MQADVADEAEVLRMFAAIDAELPPLAGLVNNAGVVDLAGARRRDERRAAASACSRSTCFGSFVCAREAIKRMSTRARRRARRRDRQPLVGGGAPRRARASTSTTPPRKGAIDVFTIGLAKEVAGRRHPRQRGAAGHHRHRHPRLRRRRPTACREMAPQVPMQRAGSADEVAEAIVWLLSDALELHDRRRSST